MKKNILITIISIILIFIGFKIFMPMFGYEIQEWQSLSVTIGLLAGGILLSLIKKPQEVTSETK